LAARVTPAGLETLGMQATVVLAVLAVFSKRITGAAAASTTTVALFPAVIPALNPVEGVAVEMRAVQVLLARLEMLVARLQVLEKHLMAEMRAIPGRLEMRVLRALRGLKHPPLRIMMVGHQEMLAAAVAPGQEVQQAVGLAEVVGAFPHQLRVLAEVDRALVTPEQPEHPEVLQTIRAVRVAIPVVVQVARLVVGLSLQHKLLQWRVLVVVVARGLVPVEPKEMPVAVVVVDVVALEVPEVLVVRAALRHPLHLTVWQ